MDKKKVILRSLASAAVLGAGVFVSQPSVVKADGGKAEEQAVAPAQPQAAAEGDSGAQTEKGSENASPANPGATNPARMTKEELMKALDELEEQAISDIKDKEAIEDKEDAAEAVKEYIGKMYISDTLESGELSLDNIIAELPEGAEDKAVVTGPEVQTNKKLSTEEKALLDQAEKDAKEQVSQATDALVQALESLENAVIEDIKKDASITNKEAAIKEAKEEIGKEDLLKAIADENLEIGDVIVDWPADTSEHKTVAEPVSEFTDEDQAKLDEADKEAQVDAAKVRSDLIATLEKIEKSTIDDINKDATITDKEAAIKAAKEVIGKDAILKAIEEGDIEASDLLDDFLAEDSDQVTPAKATSQEDFSSQDQAKLAAADKEAAEEAAKVRSDLIATLEKIEKSTIDDINKDATITDKEAAIKAAKEVIGKDGILKAIEDGDIEASDLLDDLLAEDSDQVTPAEAMSQEDFSTQDQAKLTAADKEAAEEAAKVRSDLIATLEKIEKETIDDITKDATITDKEAAIKAAKEVIGKDAILKAIEEGDIEASDLLADLLAEDSDHVTPAEAKTQSQLSSQDQAKLATADKEAAEEAAKVRSDLIATLEKIEKETIDDITKDATITDKEAAIKAAKEVIGKDGILKAIEDGDIEASDLLDDFLAEDSEQVIPAEAKSQSQLSSQDQAKLAAADKEAAEEAAKVRSDLIATLEKIEKSTIDDINKVATITDKEAAIKAAKEVIGKDAILKAIEDGDIEASDLLADFLAEDSEQVTPAEAMSQEDFSSQDQAKLTAADKEAAEEAAKVRSDLIATLEKIEKSTIDDINKVATITDKEAAIKAAKEVIGKDAILKAIEDGDIEASDLLDDFLAEDSDQVTPAEAKSQEDFSSQDQAKLTAADKEAAEENSNAKKLELSKLEEQVAKIKAQLSSLQVSGDKNSQVKDLQQALVDYENAIKSLSSVMSAVLEIEDFKGGVNAVEAATAELPEYNKGANAVEAAVNELPVYAESGAPSVANVPAYGESGTPTVANIPAYGESGAPSVANVPAYGESGTPIVNNTLPYAESGAPAVVNVPAYGESGTPIVNNALPYGESGAPALANVPVYAESGAPAVANIPAYAEKIEPAVNEVPEYTGSVAPLATNPTLGTEQDRTYKAPAATDEQLLPNTGSQDASAVASLGFVGLLLGLLPFAKRKLNK
ncbi:SIALI-17 repeat-containing surface protein [Streptococcus oralis]|uniref:Cell wall anchor protein n=1 Tax=Streptococcus oralis TaxID=1303 RepID=A0AAW5WIP3_STROR|nr:SIALI-17 repeat-containing surface protein [Streptococcus oralis]MCY7060786.1 cell wall anchor protein [Streptococcus oralis]